MEYVIKTHELTKTYGTKTVVDKLSMNVKKGDIYGFIGKNGAGKTTTMKMLLGMAFPTGGEIELFGKKASNKSRRKVGSLIEAPGIFKNCTAYENLHRLSYIYGGSDKEIKELLEIVNLSDTGNKKAGQFSLGMRQRLGIAAAMLGNPQLLVLDEPVNGLDPAANKRVRDAVVAVNREKGVTVLISSHLLGELAKIANCYGIINSGVLVEEISADELEKKCGQSLSIKCRRPDIASKILRERFNLSEADVSGEEIVLKEGFELALEINKQLVSGGAEVYDIHTKTSDMEDYFIERIGR